MNGGSDFLSLEKAIFLLIGALEVVRSYPLKLLTSKYEVDWELARPLVQNSIERANTRTQLLSICLVDVL